MNRYARRLPQVALRTLRAVEPQPAQPPTPPAARPTLQEFDFLPNGKGFIADWYITPDKVGTGLLAVAAGSAE